MTQKTLHINAQEPAKWILKIVLDLALVYAVYAVCRIAFVLENYALLSMEDFSTWMRVLRGGLLFDSSAIMYTNALWLLLVVIPLHYKEVSLTAAVCRWYYVVVNTLCAAINLMDAVYFQFTERRTTVTFFEEFGGNDNLLKIFFIECVNHWYFVVLLAAMAFMLWKYYANPVDGMEKWTRKAYYITHACAVVLSALMVVCGIRGGGFTKASRPISMSNANQYAATPAQAAAVLNTPFSLIRTITKGAVEIPRFFADESQIPPLYSALHYPQNDSTFQKKNVVVLIVESFADEFIGARNRQLDGGTYRGYTEFIDSLLPYCLTFETTLCNGWVSVDAIPAVLSSMPKMQKSFITSPYATDDIPGLAKTLRSEGYHTAFFHGADNSSMGFQGAAKSTGFENYYGRDDYKKDPRFGGDNDFDGTWAIWDEEFLQYFCTSMSEMPQPFVTSVFTATSHHPFALPHRYESVYKDEGKHKLHKCIRYTDNALRQFFASARMQPWYSNTIFVITADHASSKTTHPVYETDLGDFRVPILIYDPSGCIPSGTRPGVMQHIDIMPTLLGILGYDKPYFSFGRDVLHEGRQWAMNWHNIPQYLDDEYLLQLDDNFKATALYRYSTDSLLSRNLIEEQPLRADSMALRLKAVLQTYDTSMKSKTYKKVK